jgi:hypothetical protein
VPCLHEIDSPIKPKFGNPSRGPSAEAHNDAFSNAKRAALVLLIGGATALAAACSKETAGDPTAPQDPGGRLTINTVTLTLYGPDSITATGNYSYVANFSSPYPSFQWFARKCASLTVSACDATGPVWTELYSGIEANGYSQTYTTGLVPDCTGMGTKSYQVRVTASGFAQGPQTKYKATKLCAELP